MDKVNMSEIYGNFMENKFGNCVQMLFECKDLWKRKNIDTKRIYFGCCMIWN